MCLASVPSIPARGGDEHPARGGDDGAGVSRGVMETQTPRCTGGSRNPGGMGRGARRGRQRRPLHVRGQAAKPGRAGEQNSLSICEEPSEQ